MCIIYFDNAATTRPSEAALNAFLASARDDFGNPSSLHSLGIRAESIVNKAKNNIESYFFEEGEVIFTSGATESNNQALFSAAKNYGRKLKGIITTEIEHPSVNKPLAELEKQGFKVSKTSPLNNIEDKIIEAVDDGTFLLSLIAVNNETGYIIDTKKVYEGVKKKSPNTVIHVDGVQGFLKLKLFGDLISISGHKIGTPKGIGALYVKKGINISPIIYGGGQQKDLRSGTIPVEMISAFEAAILNFNYDISYFQKLKNHFLQLLSNFESVTVNSVNHLPNIINFSVLGIKSEVMVHFLAERGIFVSAGSACSNGKVSPVLTAFGLNQKEADSAIRVSLSPHNTKKEIDIFFTELEQILKRLRRKR